MADKVLVLLQTGESVLFESVAEFMERRAAADALLSRGQRRAAEHEGAVKKLKTSAEMAEMLSCNSTLVEQMAKDGRIPSVRVGKLLRFEPREVLAALRVNQEHL